MTAEPSPRRRGQLHALLPALLVLLGALSMPAGSAGAAEAGEQTAQTASADDLFNLSKEPIMLSFAGVFLIASITAVWFGIERLVVLRRGRVIPRAFVERILEHIEQGQIDKAEALKVCEENESPLAQIFAHGIRKWGKPSVEVEQAIIDGGERQVSQLRKHLRVLNGVATVTPLIGLLGTVIGMIHSFSKIQEAAVSDGGGKMELAIGIATALLTTAAGLAIAIPSLIMYMYLAGRVDSLVMEMDELGQDLVHLISAEALAEAATAPRKAVPPKPKAAGKPSAKSA